jgi:branched-chain amino acid transport system substrate-binding protein
VAGAVSAVLGAACSQSAATALPPAIDAGVARDAGASDAPLGEPTASPNEWVIGVTNSLTGGLRSLGPGLHNAWSVAETYVNAYGGILGKPVHFVEIDDETDDDTQADQGAVVIGVANQLIAQNPMAVIGPNGSAQVNSVWKLFQAHQILELSATATSVAFATLPDDAGPADRYFFRTVPADDRQGIALALLAQVGSAGAISPDAGATAPDGGPGIACPRLAAYYYANAYGSPMYNAFKQRFPGQIVSEGSLTEGQASYVAEATAIYAAKPDCLAMILYDADGDNFMRALLAQYGGERLPFIMGTDGVYTSTFLSSGLASPTADAGTTVAEGVYGTTWDSDPTESPDYQFFRGLYTTAFPLPPGETNLPTGASNEFDAAMLIALSIAQSGGQGGPKLRDALLAITNPSTPNVQGVGPAKLTQALEYIQNGDPIDYIGASGPCDIAPATGSVSGGYIFWQVKNGTFVTLRHVRASELQ